MRFARYCLFNGVFAASIWFGLFKGVDGAQNIVLFMAWFGFCVSWVSLSDEVTKSLAERLPPVPIWFDALFDFATVAALVWFGWFWTAMACALTALVIQSGRNRGKTLLAAGTVQTPKADAK
jgi:hypothetical protein